MAAANIRPGPSQGSVGDAGLHGAIKKKQRSGPASVIPTATIGKTIRLKIPGWLRAKPRIFPNIVFVLELVIVKGEDACQELRIVGSAFSASSSRDLCVKTAS
jgi:hypothetical protein